MTRLSVRMYQVGFGDSFLVGVGDAGTEKWVLIDCGTITEGKEAIGQVVENIVTTCTPAGGGTPRIELVIATHRHRDHVGGFTDSRWADVEVGEVWMPWTEHPTDPDATRIRTRQSALALALVGGEDDDGLEEPLNAAPRLAGAAGLANAARAMALNALTNAKAMGTLHAGFQGSPPRRFLPEKDAPSTRRELATLPGVTFHVLGPPRDDAALKLLDPPEGKGFLRWPKLIPPTRTMAPFADRYTVTQDDYMARLVADGATFRTTEIKDVNDTVEDANGLLGVALDRAVNNTSLVLAIEVGGNCLLFTGDAQWGSWKAILDDPAKRVVLKRTTLLKVGHHGSHNATPRELLEDILDKPNVALFSTKKVKQWPNIPRQPMLDEMGRRDDSVARTDAMAAAGPFTVGANDLYVDWRSDA